MLSKCVHPLVMDERNTTQQNKDKIATLKSQDKFYTSQPAAKKFIELIEQHVDLDAFDNIIEPSAGAGALLKHLPEWTIGVDIEPDVRGIINHDFLTWEYPKGKNITIGNPPFGKRSDLAVKFFNRAARNSGVVAFIVPVTWEKYSIHRRLREGWALIASERLPEKSFELDGKPYAVRCCMQIWVKQDDSGMRLMSRPDGNNPYFDFVNIEECDFAIRQAHPKTVLKSDVDGQSHYFIKPKVEGVFEVFDSIQWQNEDNRQMLGGASVPCLDRVTVVKFYEKHSNTRQAA